MKGFRVLLAVVALVLLAVPASAQASFHLMKIREVYVGDTAHPNSEYVVLQMYASGQNFVNGHKLTEYGSCFTCSPTDTTFGANVANGQTQQTILLATPEAETQFSITADETLPSGVLNPAHGAVCWATDLPTPVDCVAWGTFTDTAGVGTPVAAPTDGMALTRTIAPNCPTMLEAADDTNNSATDFTETTPTPRNNASPITETPCAPDNTALPTISGTPVAGQTLTCNRGTWSGSPPIAYSYEWLRDGVALSGETAATYVIKAADPGHFIRCRVTASNGGGSAMATSAAVAIKRPPKNTAPPTITGQPKVGRTLTCNKGTWTGSAPITYAYRWLRNGTGITGATGTTYVAKAADAGKFLSCKVTAHNAAGTAKKTSAAVKIN
jgi:hypothetical protein